MKKGIMKLVVAIAFLALPSICPAQGFLGTLLQGVAQGLQQVNQQMQQQQMQQQQQQQQNNGNNVQGGYKTNSGRLIDQTYWLGGAPVPPTSNSNSNSSSSTQSTRLCSACAGKGNCNVCRNHAGWAGVNPSAGKCRSCNGTAVCYICHGAGRVSN